MKKNVKMNKYEFYAPINVYNENHKISECGDISSFGSDIAEEIIKEIKKSTNAKKLKEKMSKTMKEEIINITLDMGINDNELTIIITSNKKLSEDERIKICKKLAPRLREIDLQYVYCNYGEDYSAKICKNENVFFINEEKKLINCSR